MNYEHFFAVIITSMVVMFGLMYLNTYALDHILFSQTRMWVAIYMGAVMAIIILAFMLGRLIPFDPAAQDVVLLGLPT